MYLIHPLPDSDRPAAWALVWQVFCTFEAPDYGPQGTAAFRRFLADPRETDALDVWGAYDGKRLLGVLATRNGRSHIALCFVDGAHHRRGIGTALFKALLSESRARPITVNASPYALPFYQRLCFVPTGPTQTADGIRFTPMQYRE